MYPTSRIVHSRKSAKNDQKRAFFDEKNSISVSVSGRFRAVPGRSILFISTPRHTGSPPVFWRGCALSDRDQLSNIVLSEKPVELRRTPQNPTEPRRIMDLRPRHPHIIRRQSPLQETDTCRTTPTYLSTSGIPLSVVHIPERHLVHRRSGPPYPTPVPHISDRHLIYHPSGT